MTSSTEATASRRSNELPTHDICEQAEKEMQVAHDSLEQLVWQLEHVVSRYHDSLDQDYVEVPPSGPPTLADIGFFYDFTESIETRASEFVDFHKRLVEIVEQVNAMRRDAPLRGVSGDA